MSYKLKLFLWQRFTDAEVHLNCEANIKFTAVKHLHIMCKYMSKCSVTDKQLNKCLAHTVLRTYIIQLVSTRLSYGSIYIHGTVHQSHQPFS